MRLFSTIKSPGLTKVGIASIFRKKGNGRSTTVATQKEHDQEEVVFCVDGDPEEAKTSNNNNIPDPSTACTSPSTNRSKSSNGQSKKSKLRATVDKYQGRIRRFSNRKKNSKKSSPSNFNQGSGSSEVTTSKTSDVPSLAQDPKDGLTWSLSTSHSNSNQGTPNHVCEGTHDVKSPKKELKVKDSLDSGHSHQGNPDRIFRSIDNKASSNASSSRLLHEFTDKDHCIDCFEMWAAQSSSASTKQSHEEDCLPKHHVDSIALDRNTWEKIPQYSRIDLSVNKHLGKGAFSDVFEVIVMAETQKALPDGGSKKIDMFDSSTSRRERTNSIDGVTNVGVKKDGRRRRTRSVTFDPKVSASNCNDTEARSVQRTYAMKCLRPFIRSDPEQFIIGVEDLVHETTVLASLDHPNIIKLRGRASGGSGGGFASKSLRPDDRYFILLDRLNDTLEDRIEQWKEDKIASSTSNNGPPSLIQVKTACSIADALSYLHSKNIVFCDLKPANLGFDSKGVLKLFDFGLSTDLNQHPVNLGDTGSSSESDLIRDQRGTLRYMSPEVGLGLGYSFPADVHSFGITLWQICSLQKPFRFVKSPYTFHRKVFEEGERPVISELWPQMLKNIMSRCWSNLPEERPTMDLVKTILHAHAPEYDSQQRRSSDKSTRVTNQLFRKLSESRSF